MSNNILLVDDDPGTIQVLARMLSGVGQLRFATGGEAALRLARQEAPDLVLLDAEMPGMNGFQTCEAMKADPELADVPVIFVTSHAETPFEVAGLGLGAADFIAKPVSEPLLVARVKTQLRVKRLTDELRCIATIDTLTGVANRRQFEDLLSREWLRGKRYGDEIALMMIAIDHFEHFNDTYGPPAGDVCLQTVAHALRDACLRPSDSVARLGGEKFGVLLPQASRTGAQRLAQRALEAVRALNIPHEASPDASHVTISAGIAHYAFVAGAWAETPAHASVAHGERTRDPAQDFRQCADQALCAAKNGGRDQAWLIDMAFGDPHAFPVPVKPAQAHAQPPPMTTVARHREIGDIGSVN